MRRPGPAPSGASPLPPAPAALAPVSRRSVAEALVTVTVALTTKAKGASEPRLLRQALFAWAFNPATREQASPPQIAAALDWAERASLPVASLDDPAIVRLALGACARTLAGKPAAGSTQRRKRSVFYNALAPDAALLSARKASGDFRGCCVLPPAARATRGLPIAR